MKKTEWVRLCCKGLSVLAVSGLVSCNADKDYYDAEWERPHCEFTFTTDATVTLNLTYQNLPVSTSVYFEVYDTMPVDEVNGCYVKKPDVLPLFGAYTGTDGKYTTQLTVPSYLKDVYIYTPAFFAKTLIKTTCEGGIINATDQESNGTKLLARLATRAGSTSTEYECTVVESGEWHQLLGEWDESTGIVTGFTEPGESTSKYETQLVSYSSYPLSSSWGWWYYYTDPETNETVYVSTFYDKNGNRQSSSRPKSNSYYYRKVAVTSSSTTETYHPGYAYTYSGEGYDLSIDESTAAELYKAHTAVISSNSSCPEEYRSSKDMLINDDAEMAVTFLGTNTCWNCSLGYYYYTDGDAPSSLSDANPIVIFPNTQDGTWSNNPTAAALCKGVERGTCVQLKYYPNLAAGDTTGATTVFPKGTRIGFVLSTNTWSHATTSNFSGAKKSRSATNSGLSLKPDGTKYNTPRTALYKYNDYVMISFEDYDTDENFSDVVIALKANPIESISEITDVTQSEIVTKTQVGIWAFEDIWPYEGDYDMNDVIVDVCHEKAMPVETTITTNVYGETTDIQVKKSNKMSRESFYLKVFQNYAEYDDGVACILSLTNESAIDHIAYTVKNPGSSSFEEFTPVKAWHKTDIYKQHGDFAYNNYGAGQYDVVRLDDNVKTRKDNSTGHCAEYCITIYYKDDSQPDLASESSVYPYINVMQGTNKPYEVHIPLEAPTNDMVKTLWSKPGTADASLPATVESNGKGCFYVRANNINNYLYGPWYPFAIKLSGATVTDLKALLDSNNECTPISTLYPHYEDWVKSNGTDYTDWYKTTSAQ